ncbi:MAG: glycosyltransferase [Patescibacteria group bacterium]|nr:glycosyltransferase [Patescibacteria group bacterium]
MRIKTDISVIVPTYNEEKYVETTLKSIKNQKTGLNYEIIVSDCKSSDKTIEIAKKYADKIIISKKRTPSCARNTGTLIAKGKILVFIDADTKILPDYIEFIFRKFRKIPHLVGLSTSFKFSRQSPNLIFAEEITNSYLLMRSQLDCATLPGFNTCILKDKFEKVGGFKDSMLEDVQLSKDINLLGKVKYLPEKKVITSSRKLEKVGVLGTLRYYFDLAIIKNDIDLPFKKINKTKDKILDKITRYKDIENIR